MPIRTPSSFSFGPRHEPPPPPRDRRPPCPYTYPYPNRGVQPCTGRLNREVVSYDVAPGTGLRWACEWCGRTVPVCRGCGHQMVRTEAENPDDGWVCGEPQCAPAAPGTRAFAVPMDADDPADRAAARQMNAALAEATIEAKQALTDRARPAPPARNAPPHPSHDARGWHRRFTVGGEG